MIASGSLRWAHQPSPQETIGFWGRIDATWQQHGIAAEGKGAVVGTPSPYSINLNTRFGPLELIDVQTLVDACKVPWYNQTLCRINDCVIRLGVLQGEFHWHKHDKEDEFFYVIEGRFEIDVNGRTVQLGPREGFSVPKGVMHRTRAPERTVILMIEGAGIQPTGD